MRMLAALASALIFVLPTAGVGQAAPPYNHSVEVPALDLYPYIQSITELNDYYLHNPGAGGSFNERMRRRNAEIRARFARLRSEREPLLTAHQRYFYDEVKCKNNHSGGHKSCPGTRTFGTGYEFFPQSVGSEGEGFHTRATLTNAGTIYWNQRRTGRGENVGHVWGTSHYSAGYIQTLLNTEANTFRAQLRERSLPDDRSVDPEGA